MRTRGVIVESLLSRPARVSFNIVKRSVACALLLAAVSGCKSRDPYVVLTVEELESGSANGAVVLAIGSSTTALSQRGILGRNFPITITLTSETEETKPLWVEAWDVNDQVVARGFTQVPFDDDSLPTVVVRLGKPCEETEHCTRPFCDGVPVCENRVCGPKTIRCGNSNGISCVQIECKDTNPLRGEGVCLTIPNHSLCEPIMTSTDTVDATYCNPQQGCIRGEGCKDEDSEKDENGVHIACQDGVKCNGIEVCENFHCVPRPLNVDDGSPCTIDACDETTGAVHFEDPLARGAECETADHARGVCNGALCLASNCGDSVVDVETEACDDGNEDPNDGCFECSLTTWTPVLVTGAGIGGTTPSEIELGYEAYLAVDRLGTLYVGDNERNVVYAIDTNTNVAAIVAGTGALADYRADVTRGTPATELGFSFLSAIAVDTTDQLYITDDYAYVFRVDDRTGLAVPYAGNGDYPFDSQLGTARSTPIGIANDIFIDGRGNLYIAGLTEDSGWVVRVDALTQLVTLVAGDYDGEDGPLAPRGTLLDPQGLAVDDDGNVYIADSFAPAVMKVDAFTGEMTPFVSPDPQNSPGRPVITQPLEGPSDVALDHEGFLYIADLTLSGDNDVIYRVDLRTDTISDYVEASAGLYGVSSLAVDPQSNLYIADAGRVQRKKRGNGLLEPVIGKGTVTPRARVVRSDSTPLNDVRELVLAPDGAPLFLVRNTVQQLDAANRTLTTVLSTSSDALIDLLAVADDGTKYYTISNTLYSIAPAPNATPRELHVWDDEDMLLHAMAWDRGGELWFFAEDYEPFYYLQRFDLSSGELTDVIVAEPIDVGDPNGDGGPADEAQFVGPDISLAVDGAGNVYIADAWDDRVRKLDLASGTIDTFAELTYPNGVSIAPAGDVLISGDNEVLRVSPDGTRRTAIIDNMGDQANGGDGELALHATGIWYSVVENAAGEIFVATGDRVRRIDTIGVITSVAGQIEPFGNGVLPRTKLSAPTSLARGIDPENNEIFFVADSASGRLRAIDEARSVQSTAVGYPGGSTSEGASAAYARTLDDPRGVVFDEYARRIYISETATAKISALDISTRPYRLSTLISTGLLAPEGMAIANQTLYVADSATHVIKKFDLSTDPPTATVVAGRENNLGYFGDGGRATEALLSSPRAVALSPVAGNFYVADYGNRRVRLVDANGRISTVIGDGTSGSGGSGRPADRLPCDEPLGLAVDPSGNLFVASKNTLRIVVAGHDGIADGSDEVLLIYGIPPRQKFPEPLTNCLAGMVLVPGDGRVMQLDRCRGFLIELTREKVPFGGAR